MTEEGRKYLCVTLKKEYDVFFSLIYSAETLSLYDRQESLKIAKSNCGKWLDFGTEKHCKRFMDLNGWNIVINWALSVQLSFDTILLEREENNN